MTALVTALATPALAQSPGRTIRRARPFILECKFKDDLYADDAVAVLRQVWKLAEQHFEPTPKMKSKKLKVFVYGDKRGYAAAAAKYRKLEFEKFQGFADGRTMTCHVLKIDAPWWTRAEMDPSNRHVIAHEAAHLVVMLCCANHGMFLPKWVAEGYPMWLEGEVMREGGWTKSRVADIDESMKVVQAQKMIAEGRFPKVDDVLHNKWDKLSELDSYYPIRMLWTFLSATHPDTIRPLLADLKTTGASAALPRILENSLRFALGEKALEKIDDRLVEFVKTRKFVKMPGVVPIPQDVVGKPGDANFKPGSPSAKWLGGTTKKSFVITAKVTIRSSGFPQADLLFGRIGDTWLRASMVPGAGAFLLARKDDDGKRGSWEVLAAGRELPALVTDKPISLRLWCRSTRVMFAVGGKTAFDHDVGGRPMQGKWGVGGPRGSIASWKSVRIR